MNHRRTSLRRLNRYLRTSDRILASWDAYTEFHTDLDGWPFDDDAYGRRAPSATATPPPRSPAPVPEPASSSPPPASNSSTCPPTSRARAGPDS
ncbi:hypothetical protein [Streptomyces coelicoflavus]|uniref:hypothetical protein n=1 Tax=Streptomyces coelicoflavus TaxID=285562 RepID=UPI003A83F58D